VRNSFGPKGEEEDHAHQTKRRSSNKSKKSKSEKEEDSEAGEKKEGGKEKDKEKDKEKKKEKKKEKEEKEEKDKEKGTGKGKEKHKEKDKGKGKMKGRENESENEKDEKESNENQGSENSKEPSLVADTASTIHSRYVLEDDDLDEYGFDKATTLEQSYSIPSRFTSFLFMFRHNYLFFLKKKNSWTMNVYRRRERKWIAMMEEFKNKREQLSKKDYHLVKSFRSDTSIS